MGAVVLIVATVWAIAAAAAGTFAYRFRQRRWHKNVTIAAILWLPFWDVVPGLFLYSRAVNEVGGLRIYRTVEADGYLDSASSCTSCWRYLLSMPYRYLEFEMASRDGQLGLITAVPGYYEYSLGERGSDECQAFDSLPHVATIRERTALTDNQCVVAVRRDEPTSRYERLHGRRAYVDWFPSVQLSYYVVRDRVTGENIAEAYQVRYDSWVSQQTTFPTWAYTRQHGRHIGFSMEEVVVPVQGQQ